VGPEIDIEQEIAQGRSEDLVVGDPLIEIEIRIHDLLDRVLDLVIEGQADILTGIDPGTRVEADVLVELPQDLPQRQPMILSKV
jgi:hypothetical protein